ELLDAGVPQLEAGVERGMRARAQPHRDEAVVAEAVPQAVDRGAHVLDRARGIRMVLARGAARDAVADALVVEAQAREAPRGEVAREHHAHAIGPDVMHAARVEEQDRGPFGAGGRAAEDAEEVLVAAEAAQALLDDRRHAALA